MLAGWRERRAQRRTLRRFAREVGAERFASFGEGALIQPPAVVLNPHRIHIGEKTLIHSGAWFSVVEEHNGKSFDPVVRIGNRVSIGRDLWISCVGEIVIEDEALIGDRLTIADSYHGYEDPDVNVMWQPMADPKPTRIEEGAHIGVGCVITQGVTIGARCYVASGAVVTRSVPANCVVVGNPARVLRHYDHARGAWVDGPPPA